jgi:hypothetical protein
MKNFGAILQELQLTDFDETTIILTAMTSRRAYRFLFSGISPLKTEKALSLERSFFRKS